ncbi:MAG: hypothetical protein ACYDHM_13870 [Acidiferrobacterales bacterium]
MQPPEGAAAVESVLRMLAPSKEEGWAQVGPVGSAQCIKMIRYGIEYGIKQMLVEGRTLMESMQGFSFDLEKKLQYFGITLQW